MKNYNMKKNVLISFILGVMTLTSACDSSLSFNATRSDVEKPIAILANLSTTVSGASSIRIPNLTSLPEDIKKANDVKIVVDNGKTAYPVVRNADGSLSFAVGSTIKLTSDGDFNAIFIADQQKSFFVTIKTGPQLKLNSPGVLLTPSTGTVIKGEKIKLAANLVADAKDKFIFNWFYGTSSTGPFLPISGTGSNVEWTPAGVGNYFVKIDMIDKSTGSVSSFLSSVSIVFVTDAKDIISVSPNSGNILRGKDASLSVNIPNLDPTKFDFTWAYAQSPQGPFLPITGNTQSVTWTPTSSGSFYIKVDSLNKEKQEISSYSTTEPLVFVTENESIIKTDPAFGTITRGASIKLNSGSTSDVDNSTYSWSYSQSNVGPWTSIPGSAKNIEWTPSLAGSYYIKTDVSDKTSGNVSTFISPKAIVFVNEASNVFKTNPLVANVNRGSYVSVTADIPGAVGKNFQYNWSYSTSLTAPFQPLFNPSGDLRSNILRWRPATEGSYYMKVDAVNLDTQSVVSFTSPNPIVFVSESVPLFKTNPDIARITQDQSVDITVNLDNPTNTIFAWSYGVSTQGPWFSIGGTTSPTITWDKKGKLPGTYYVKIDVKDSTERNITSFVSRSPIIFIDSNQTNSNAATFGGVTP